MVPKADIPWPAAAGGVRVLRFETCLLRARKGKRVARAEGAFVGDHWIGREEVAEDLLAEFRGECLERSLRARLSLGEEGRR